MYETFTGNQVGVLLADYILSRRKEKGLEYRMGIPLSRP
jgi:phosphomannomutase